MRDLIYLLLVIVAVAGLAACKDKDGRSIDDGFVYIYDPASDLCFASGYQAIAHVECTVRVKDQIGTSARNQVNLSYVVDPRTEICFAEWNGGVATVPCTDKVKELVNE